MGKSKDSKKKMDESLRHITDKDIADAAKRTGFALEVQVASILSNHGGNVQINVHLENDAAIRDLTGASTTEVDVLYSLQANDVENPTFYLIECKGASSDDKLILNKAAKNFPTSYEQILIQSGKIWFQPENNIFLSNSSGHIVCQTGDFFRWDNKKLKQYGAGEQRQNLYKGIRQIVDGVAAFFNQLGSNRILKDRVVEVIPVIVTNCEINIVKFNEGGEYFLDEPSVQREVKWAVIKNENDFIVGPLSKNETWNRKKHGNVSYRANIPYIWVVNVSHLDEFIRSTDKIYK